VQLKIVDRCLRGSVIFFYFWKKIIEIASELHQHQFAA
jgi:hypothetical protein